MYANQLGLPAHLVFRQMQATGFLPTLPSSKTTTRTTAPAQRQPTSSVANKKSKLSSPALRKMLQLWDGNLPSETKPKRRVKRRSKKREAPAAPPAFMDAIHDLPDRI